MVADSVGPTSPIGIVIDSSADVRSGPVAAHQIRRKQKKTWMAIILLSLASLVILIGLIVVLKSH